MRRTLAAMVAGLFTLGLLLGGPILGGSGSALAQAKPKDDKTKEPKVRVERRGGKKVFRITTTFVIEGRIQKPNAFYVLQRSQINYDWVKMKKDFVPRIVDATRKSPF